MSTTAYGLLVLTLLSMLLGSLMGMIILSMVP